MDARIEHLDSIIDESFTLERELRRLSSRFYPSESLKTLIDEALIPVNIELRQLFIQQVNNIRDNSSSDVSPSVLAAHRLWISRAFHRVVKAVEGADIKSHPLEIMTSIRYWLERLAPGDYGVLTSPQDQFNFAFSEVWSRMADYLSQAVGIVPEVNKRYINFIFPRMYKDDVFLSGVYVHELGHYLDRAMGLWEEVFTEEVVQHPALSEILKTALTLGQDLSEAKLLSALHEGLLGAWIRELIADTFGICILGPAFLFSANLVEVRINLSPLVEGRPVMDIVSDTHPSTALRVEHRVSLLEQQGHLEVLPPALREEILEIRSWWSESERVYQLQNGYSKELAQFFETILRDCIPAITEKVVAKVGDVTLAPEDLRKADQLAMQRLVNLLPPNELKGVPADPAVTFNSAWYARMLFKGEIQDKLPRFNDRRGEFEVTQLINGLLKHALLGSDMQRRWAKT